MENENKHSEMIDIMHTLQQYVPIKSDDVLEKSAVHKVLLGGDQLTATRARGCRDLHLNSDSDCPVPVQYRL